MKTVFLQKIRYSLLSQEQFEARRSTLSAIKVVKTASTITGLGMAGLALLNIHEGSYIKGLAMLAVAYPFHEIITLADNSKEILENPIKEFQAVCAKIHSDEEFVQFVTIDAPLLRTIGMLFIDRVEQAKPEPAGLSRFFSRICNKKD
jgi:hypothetical protein